MLFVGFDLIAVCLVLCDCGASGEFACGVGCMIVVVCDVGCD